MKYLMRDGRLVEAHLAPPKNAKHGSGANVISDVMDPARHMGTGKMHDSKSNFRSDTRAMGLTEAGTDPSVRRPIPRPEPSQHEIVNDVKRSIAELRSR